MCCYAYVILRFPMAIDQVRDKEIVKRWHLVIASCISILRLHIVVACCNCMLQSYIAIVCCELHIAIAHFSCISLQEVVAGSNFNT